MTNNGMSAAFGNVTLSGNGNLIGISSFIPQRQSDDNDNILRWIRKCAEPNVLETEFPKEWFVAGPRDRILKDLKFQPCLNGTGQTCILFGEPGVGKTTIIQGIIDLFKEKHEQGEHKLHLAAMFYRLDNSHGHTSKDCSASKVMMRLLENFVSQVPSALTQVRQLYRDNWARCPNACDTADAIVKVLGEVEQACVILDGVDLGHENNCREDLSKTLELLKSIQDKTRLGLVLTDRLKERPLWTEHFDNLTFVEIVRAESSEIKDYVKHRSLKSAMRWKNDANISETVQNKIAKASDGIFALAWLNMEYIFYRNADREELPSDDLDEIQSFATDAQDRNIKNEYGQHALKHMYDVYLSRVFHEDGVNRDARLAKRVFRYVRDAARPLTSSELIEALEMAESVVDGQRAPPNGLDWDRIRSLCTGLIDRDKFSNVYFCHDNMRAIFNESQAREILPDANDEMGQVCIQYLLRSDIPGENLYNRLLEQDLNNKTLLGYASKFWRFHYESCYATVEPSTPVEQSRRDEFHRDVLLFLQDDEKVEMSVRVAELEDPYLFNWIREAGDFTLQKFVAMHFISLDWLSWLIETIHGVVGRRDREYDPLAANQETGLHFACRQGYTSLVEQLLDAGKAPECRNRQMQTPLHLAAANDHVQVVDLLLSHGVEPDPRDKFGFTPLLVATQGGRVEAVERLLQEGGVDVNALTNSRCSPFLRSALHIAARVGDVRLARVLLKDPRVDRGIEDSVGETPLHLAARKGQLSIIKLFVEDGNFDLAVGTSHGPDGNGCTPLHLASMDDDCLPVVEYLVEMLPSLAERVDEKRRVPLHYAVHWKMFKNTKLLLKYTKNVNATTTNGHSPLSYAIQTRNDDLLNAFKADCRVNWSLENAKCQSILEQARRRGNSKIVEYITSKVGRYDNEEQCNFDAPAKTVQERLTKLEQDTAMGSTAQNLPINSKHVKASHDGMLN